jgi:hypothetical protein
MTRLETFSVAEVAADVLPVEWTDKERWLRRRLNRGEIVGYRVGHAWRFTAAQRDALIAQFTNTPAATPAPTPEPIPVDSVARGLTSRTSRRLLSA